MPVGGISVRENDRRRAFCATVDQHVPLRRGDEKRRQTFGSDKMKIADDRKWRVRGDVLRIDAGGLICLSESEQQHDE